MSNNEQVIKAVYAQPKLSVFGGFAQLTAAGSGSMVEFSGTGSSRRP
jgi:hypothetical protein